MSERSGGGFGAFLFGIVLGAVAGFVFAPTEGGESTRRKVSKGLRNLKELAEDKVDEVRGLLKEAAEEADEEAVEEEEEEEGAEKAAEKEEGEKDPETPPRAQPPRRLDTARRRRNRAARPATPPASEE